MTGPVGVVGLGAMGLPMAASLRRAGLEVLGWNRSTRPQAAARELDVPLTEDLAELGRRCPVVLTVLPDLPDVDAVLDAAGLAEGMAAAGPGSVLVVMGTVSPVAVAALPGRRPGLRVVDAPVSGGTRGAGAARLSIMVGGADDDVAVGCRCCRRWAARWRTWARWVPGPWPRPATSWSWPAPSPPWPRPCCWAAEGGLDVTALLDVLGGGLAASEVLAQKRAALAADVHDGDGAARYLAKDLGFVAAAAAAEALELPLAARRAGCSAT